MDLKMEIYLEYVLSALNWILLTVLKYKAGIAQSVEHRTLD